VEGFFRHFSVPLLALSRLTLLTRPPIDLIWRLPSLSRTHVLVICLAGSPLRGASTIPLLRRTSNDRESSLTSRYIIPGVSLGCLAVILVLCVPAKKVPRLGLFR